MLRVNLTLLLKMFFRRSMEGTLHTGDTGTIRRMSIAARFDWISPKSIDHI
jgi:hypothetical protein